MEKIKSGVILLFLLMNIHVIVAHDYKDALTKSILFFEGQRSGKLPASQRLAWRRDSALCDGSDVGVDLVGGYYDAGDNVKFNFPMAYSTTMLAWSVVEFGRFMGSDLQHALDAIKWGTDYLLKCTATPNVVYVGVGNPTEDHNCWQRPEDMDTARTTYAVTKDKPGSEVSAEIAAALAAAALAFRSSNRDYSELILQRATTVFEFANNFRGSYKESLGPAVCPFYCDFDGYEDELLWAAVWLYKATRAKYYLDYVKCNINILDWDFSEFGWDAKFAGISVLGSKLPGNDANLFVPSVNKFVCSTLPESPTVSVRYSPGGLIFKGSGSNLQVATAISFLMVVYARVAYEAKTTINCGNVVINSERLIHYANSQVDYILGNNPMKMSYMVGYGNKFPQKIHHRGSSLPSVAAHPNHLGCKDGTPFFNSPNPNPNQLTGAIVGGPEINDVYPDSRILFNESEPTTYINAPFVGTLAFFNSFRRNGNAW